MFIRYNSDSGDEIYHIWNSDMNRVQKTRYNIWIKSVYYQYTLTMGLVEDVMKFEDVDINELEVGESDDEYVFKVTTNINGHLIKLDNYPTIF